MTVQMSKTRYRAERINREADGKRLRIIKKLVGPFAEYREVGGEHVAEMSDEQARQLRDDLNEVLGDD